MAKVQTEMLLDFVYDGVNRRGEKVKGETTSRNIELAKAQLRKQGIKVKTIKKKPKPIFQMKKSVYICILRRNLNSENDFFLICLRQTGF